MKVYLELLGLGKAEQPLGISVLISIAEYLDIFWKLYQISKKEFNIFANSIKSTTIQDGGKRERSNAWV